MADQKLRFCTTDDGVRICYATVGEGPPLVKAQNWLSHIEFEWHSPVWGLVGGIVGQSHGDQV